MALPSRAPVKTVVLTSRENFVWHSMQEIIPAIEADWQAAARAGRHEVVCLNVDGRGLSELVPAAMDATNFVMTCFNLKMAEAVGGLRGAVGIDARLFVYLHNQATIGCWPFWVFGPADALRTGDVFLSSCSLDAATLSHSFIESRVECLPFSLPQLAELQPAPTAVRVPGAPVSFVFVGRVSVQKNLHTLIHAFSLLSRLRPELAATLEIFGQEDDLGSPNMGWEGRSYLAWLRELGARLELADALQFRGHLAREALYEELDRRPHVFVSSSLHSDENFGMAALRALAAGNPAVLSAWGGHVDFESSFPEQVSLAGVYESERGPYVDARELAERMLESATATSSVAPILPSRYRRESIASELFRLATEKQELGRPLVASETARQLVDRRARFLKDSPRESKIFTSYADPAALPFLRGYGMKAREAAANARDADVALAPWVQVESGLVQVEDPHRGDFEIRFEPQGSGLPSWVLERLISSGYAQLRIPARPQL